LKSRSSVSDRADPSLQRSDRGRKGARPDGVRAACPEAFGKKIAQLGCNLTIIARRTARIDAMVG